MRMFYHDSFLVEEKVGLARVLYYNFCLCIPCKCIENSSDRYQLVFFFSVSLSFGPNFHIQSHLERNRRLGSLVDLVNGVKTRGKKCGTGNVK